MNRLGSVLMHPVESRHRLQRYLIRRRRRHDIDDVANQIIASFDGEEFNERFGHYRDKLLDLARWMPEAVARFYVHGLHRLPPGASICDLGCGSGYFMLVCRHFGHRAVGVDLDRDPMYNDMIDFFNLERVVYRIEPHVRLPQFSGAPFDAVTAFMTCFNRYSDGRPWTEAEWRPFLEDLRAQLKSNGRVIVKFNRNRRKQELYPASLPKVVRQLPMYKSRFYGDMLEMRAV